MNEYEGRDENVSRRTVQADIQMMRSDKLGYNAPIVVRQNRYYTYEDPEYSIVDVPLSSQDTELLSEAVGILKQLSGFSALLGIEDIRGHGRVHHLPTGSHSQSRAGEGPSRLRVRNHSPVTAVTRGVHQETPQSIGESVRSLFRYCENNLPQAIREQTPHENCDCPGGIVTSLDPLYLHKGIMGNCISTPEVTRLRPKIGKTRVLDIRN